MIRTLLNGSGRYVVVGMAVLMLGFGYLGFMAKDSGDRERYEPGVFESLEADLAEQPYDGALLLRTARHGVQTVRYYRQQPEQSEEDLRDIILTSLEAYRRLDSSPRWEFSARDQFNAAYLYHQLGRMEPDVDYVPRARDMALRSYEEGYRSDELTTLLGNLHVELGEYERALEFYDSLGSTIRDPVVLFNKAWTHRASGNLERANRLLVQTHNMVQEEPEEFGNLIWQIREASLTFRLDQEDYDRVLSVLREQPDWLERPNMRVLKARALLESGRTSDAREHLEELIDVEPVARTARLLLEDLDEST